MRKWLAAEIIRLVRDGDEQLARKICATLPQDILDRSGAAGLLMSNLSLHRYLGLARVVVEHAYAANPSSALDLWEALEEAGIEPLGEIAGASANQRGIFVGSVTSSVAKAALQLGAFDRALSLAEEGERLSREYDTNATSIWLENVRYEILIRRLEIPQALALRQSRLPDTGSPADGRLELDAMLAHYAPVEGEDEILRPAETFSWTEQTKAMLLEWVESQAVADSALEASYATVDLPAEARATMSGHFATMRRAREDIREAVSGNVGNRHRDDVVQLGLFHHQAAARAIQSPPMDRPRTLQDNNHDLNHAAQIVGMRDLVEVDLQTALQLAKDCVSWSAKAGDRHGQMLALWTAGQAAERLRDLPKASAFYEDLLRLLMDLRPSLPSAYGRAILSRGFRTLIPRVVSLAIDAGRPEAAFKALEFHRGLGLSASERSELLTGELPDGILYLAISVFPDQGIFLALRTTHGVQEVRRLAIDLDQAYAAAAFIDPSTWRHPLNGKSRSPRSVLQPFIQPLCDLLRSGLAARDDHVVLALDHPFHMVPVHYLDLAGRPAVETFSFSRAASFRDLQMILERPTSRPAKTCAVFVEPADAAMDGQHDAEFRKGVSPLRNVDILKGVDADGSALKRVLSHYDLVHIHCHGIFPETYPSEVVDPVNGAGLLLAASGRLPSRAHPASFLFKAGDILKGDRVCSDVSLSACVSGLGRPGKGQDMLGLEFALRSKGGRTIIASHWHVDVELAAAFFHQYYKNWLDTGLSRAQAWRQSILTNMADADTTAQMCAHCAFSIHGDWR
jgi:CHAT domain-containing protein